MLLKAGLAKAKAELKTSKDITKELEHKIAAAESEAYRVYTEGKHWKDAVTKKDDEIKALKIFIKNAADEKHQISVDLLSIKKSLKLKDKEIHGLENYKMNHQETVHNLKENVNDLKKENKTLEKRTKGLEKKVFDIKNENILEANNNKPAVTLASTATCPVSSSSSLLSTPFSSPSSTPSSVITAPTLTTQVHPVSQPSPLLGEEGDRFKEALVKTFEKQNKAIQDWFQSKIDDG